MLALSVQNNTFGTVINALKSKGVLKGAQASIVSSYTKLRNAAMHADWSKIDDADVSRLIGFLEPFLLQNFVWVWPVIASVVPNLLLQNWWA